MARAQATDYFHVFKFQMKVVTGGIAGASEIVGGFTNITIPEVSTENVEYKEGIWLYRRKFMGDPTFSDITATQGVIKGNTAFFDWIFAAYTGQEYRIDLQILQFHRDDVSGLIDYTNAQASRIYNCFECIPLRVKPSSDLDAQSSEVALAELDIQIERMEIVAV
jgi:phage tail-like protein